MTSPSREAQALPPVLTVVNDLDDLKDKWKISDIIMVGLGLGIPALIYDQMGGFDVPSPEELGGITMRDVRKLQQAGEIEFTSGHPLAKNTYLVHPAVPRRYLPARDSAKMILREKWMQAVRLLLALGATDVTAHWGHSEGESKGGGATVSAAQQAEFAASMGAERSTSDSGWIVVEGAVGKRTDIPDLSWLDHDDAFQLAVATADAGAGHLKLVLSSSDDRSDTFAMIAKANKAGIIDLHGNLTRWDEVMVALDARFRPSQP